MYTGRLLPASGGGSARQGAGRPSPHGPAAPRRNLITLFSWFKFCFLIKKKKKMTLLSSGPRPCDVPCTTGVTFKRLAGRQLRARALRAGGGAQDWLHAGKAGGQGRGWPTSPCCAPGQQGPARLGPSPGFGPQMVGGLGRERPGDRPTEMAQQGCQAQGPPQNPLSPPNRAHSTPCSQH